MDLAEIQKSPEEALKLIQNMAGQIEQLQEELRLALLRKFGRSSEKIDPNQQELFEELSAEAVVEAEDDSVVVPAHKRSKTGRKPLDSNIPREDIIHDLTDEEKVCGCGAHLAKVDEVITERLNVIPEQIYVERHIRYKYACRNCEGSGDEDKPVFRLASAAPVESQIIL